MNPTYLHWVLNTQRIQSLKEGTNISFISEKNLGNVDLPVPALEAQHKIAQLNHLHSQRTNLRHRIAALDEKILQASAWALATEARI